MGLKRELSREVDALRREQKAFKCRIGVLANIFIPGFGFFIYGSSYVKGVVCFVLYIFYNLFYLFVLLPDLSGILIGLLYYIPAFLLWLISTIMVSELNS